MRRRNSPHNQCQKGNPFKTNRLMVSHSNEYRPPKPGENLKNWQKSLEVSEK